MKVGIAGHQNISAHDTSWIKKSLSFGVKTTKASFGYSSLAIGVAQLFVDLLLQFSIPYSIIIPCHKYEKTFKTKDDRSNYLDFLSRADEKVILDYDEPSEKAFYAAGKKVVELSDTLIAVWDGKNAKGLGGTADIVKYALTLKRQVLHINPLDKTQILIKND